MQEQQLLLPMGAVSSTQFYQIFNHFCLVQPCPYSVPTFCFFMHSTIHSTNIDLLYARLVPTYGLCLTIVCCWMQVWYHVLPAQVEWMDSWAGVRGGDPPKQPLPKQINRAQTLFLLWKTSHTTFVLSQDFFLRQDLCQPATDPWKRSPNAPLAPTINPVHLSLKSWPTHCS